MKTVSRLAVFLLAMCLVFGAYGEQTTNPREEITLTMFYEGNTNQHPLKLEEIKRLFNINLNVISTPTAEYDQKLNLAMASGEKMDIILFRNLTEMFSYAKQGALMPLDKLLEDHAPNTRGYVPQKLWPYMQADGATYAIPTERITQKNNLYIRQDWLDKLSLPVPETLEDLRNVMKAFVEQDPDGNGVNDTYGYGSSAAGALSVIGTFSPIFGAFGVMDGAWYFDEDNQQLRPYDIHPNMKEALSYIRELYSAGLIVPDWLVIKGAQADAYIDSSKVGLFYGFWTYGDRREENIKTLVPEAKVVPIAPPIGADGLQGNRSSGYVGTRVYSLTANTKYPERAMELLDYFHSTEGFLFGRYGLEGSAWNWKNGAKTPQTVEELDQMVDQFELTEQYTIDMNAGSSAEFLNLYQPQHDITLLPGWEEDQVYAQKFTQGQPIVFDESDGLLSDVKSKYSAALNTLRDETFTKIIMGEYPIEKFDEFVEKWKGQGGLELIEDLTVKYANVVLAK